MSDLSDAEDISDEEIYNIISQSVTRERVIRRRPQHFEKWDDVDFYSRFRLSKHSAMMILDLIQSQIKNMTDWNSALSPACMLLLTLRFYAGGGLLISAGDFCGVSKSTASRVVKKISHHIALLREKFVHFPLTDDEKPDTVLRFYSIARFPRVIAAMDCTHVRIQSPGGESAEVFRNRKGFFSINVQTLCDSQLRILDIVARWPGSTHDSTIFNNSRICSRFDNGEFQDYFIVADGGYAAGNYVMTPLRTCDHPEENLYNECQIRTRNCVERLYGVWKRRFPVLAMGMRLKMSTIQSVIVSTAVLHNICCINNEGEPAVLNDSMEDQIRIVNSVPNGVQRHASSNRKRELLIQTYFRNLL